MTDYTELIRSLRNCSNNRCTPCDCGWFNKYQVDESCKEIIMWKAAAAIEELQQIADHYEQTAKDYWKQACDYKSQLPKRGKWIRHPEVKNIYGGEYIECPFCGEKYVVQYIADEKFCRNCGADMRKMEVQDENR